MTIKWEAFDLHQVFHLGLAACLWAESLPESSDETSVNAHLMSNPEIFSIFAALCKFGTDLLLSDPKEGHALVKHFQKRPLLDRDVLVKYANQVGQKPKFLFPEERDSFEAVADPKDNEPESTPPTTNIHTRRMNSWRKLVKTLAIVSKSYPHKKIGEYPSDRNTAGALRIAAQNHEMSLDDDVIRELLIEAFEFTNDPKKPISD